MLTNIKLVNDLYQPMLLIRKVLHRCPVDLVLVKTILNDRKEIFTHRGFTGFKHRNGCAMH